MTEVVHTYNSDDVIWVKENEHSEPFAVPTTWKDTAYWKDSWIEANAKDVPEPKEPDFKGGPMTSDRVAGADKKPAAAK